MKRIAIIGLGLIGGSLALATRQRQPHLHVVAVDRPEVLASEAARAVCDERVSVADTSALTAALSRVDLAVLATPVHNIIELLPCVLGCAPLVTDCGSTKRAIVERVEVLADRSHFVPGHPMAGRPVGGLANASAELFDGCNWILCPEKSDAHAVTRVGDFVRALGARLVLMTAAEHDRAVALTSHVPQILASALAVLAARAGAEPAAGPAFASATRVAGGSPAMWADIFTTNADAIASVLNELIAELRAVASGLRGDEVDTCRAIELLQEARRIRDRA